jgi:hypothetical protein
VRNTRDRAVLAAALGAADGLASLALHAGLSAGLAVIAVAALACALLPPGRRRLAALPLLLSIDNLLVPLAAREALIAGLESFALAGAGFVASSLCVRIVSKLASRIVARS